MERKGGRKEGKEVEKLSWKQGHHHHHITSHRELAWNGNWFIVYRLAGSMDGHGWVGARETLISGSLARWNGMES